MSIFAWLSANLLTVILSILIAVLFLLTVIHLIRSRKQGKSTCGCGCAGCPHSGACHNASDATTQK